MDPVGLIMFALSYVVLQSSAIIYLRGRWLWAAVFPVPVLCVILVLSVSAGLFGVNGAEIGAIAVVPLGVAYLATLMVLSQIARFLGSPAS